ncbi:MAG TPA: NAD-dependent epimerase/dehydratase family protein [Bryobacteraceae bacterium]|nr:NAD-dependent epimerase/dehydratase family protein [Bryobacteraceae bacterium]
MRALVTGGAGYFGTLLVNKLLQQNYEVRIFDLNRPDPPIPGVEVVQGDIGDMSALANACKGMDVAFHNVAHNPLAKDDALFWAVNRDGTANLLRASLEQNVAKVVYTSTSAVFGAPKILPVTEETTASPMEVYGRAKLAGETVCHEYAARGLDASIVRSPTILGHGRLGIFQLFFEWIYRGSNIPVLGGGKNKFQFIHADDLADACILASQRKGAETYNCGADRFGTMREAIEHLCRYAGTGSRVRSLPLGPIVLGMNIASALRVSPLAPYHALMYGRPMYFDVTKAKTQLGWRPRYSNEEMFVDSYRWYVANRESILHRSDGASRHQIALGEGALFLVRWLL